MKVKPTQETPPHDRMWCLFWDAIAFYVNT